MLEILKILDLKKELVLASASPRRRLLLRQIGLEFRIKPANVDENYLEYSGPEDFVTELAERKANAVAEKYYSSSIVLGADTTVSLNGELLNKPIDVEDAYDILRRLSGNTHEVYTGVSLIYRKSSIKKTFYKKTEVTFRELDDDEIDAYIETGLPMDKAGAYGIQDDFGSVFVKEIKGCFYNVVGLPLEAFYTELKKINDAI